MILRDPAGKRALQILEQNYRADPISQGLAAVAVRGQGDRLSGPEERRARPDRSRQDHPQRLRLISRACNGTAPQYAQEQMARASYESGGQPIIEVNGKLRFSLPGQPLFPSLADDTILKPTLHWVLETRHGRQARRGAQLRHRRHELGGGLQHAVAQTKGEAIDVIGWVTMDNQSGKTFENARIKLMAGDVSKIQPEAVPNYAYAARAGGFGGPMQPPCPRRRSTSTISTP